MLRAGGKRVEVQNYIDNTGVQVADVVVGFHYLEKKSLADVQALLADPAVRFDYYCWDLYAHTSSYYKDHPESLPWRSATLHAIEAGEGEVAELAHLVADAIVKAHLKTMLRLDVEYDVLPRESEILHLKFWASAFELLKERKAIYFETEGKNSGCWVMPGLSEEGKVIVRSDGTVTYVGKDIAYQLWKFGLLGKDFYYRPFQTYADGRVLWVTTDEPADAGQQFGHGTRVFNVIDARQSYLQDVVVAGLRALGYNEQAEQSIHFNYEMVALSPRCCADLGIPLSEEDRKRPYVEVSGRKGLGVKADDLMDSLIAKALEEVGSRHPDDAGGKESARGHADRHRGTALFPVEVHAQYGDRFRSAGGVELRGRDRAVRAVLGGARAQYSAQAGRARRADSRLRQRARHRGDGATAPVRRFLADAAGGFEGGFGGGERGALRASPRTWRGMPSNWRRRSAISTRSTRSSTSRTARRKVFLLWMTDFFRRQLERTGASWGFRFPSTCRQGRSGEGVTAGRRRGPRRAGSSGMRLKAGADDSSSPVAESGETAAANPAYHLS